MILLHFPKIVLRPTSLLHPTPTTEQNSQAQQQQQQHYHPPATPKTTNTTNKSIMPLWGPFAHHHDNDTKKEQVAPAMDHPPVQQPQASQQQHAPASPTKQSFPMSTVGGPAWEGAPPNSPLKRTNKSFGRGKTCMQWMEQYDDILFECDV